MNERIFKNKITTLFGIAIWLITLLLYMLTKFGMLAHDFTTGELILLGLLGWVFVTAKNSLIKGLFLNVFKIKE